MESKKGEIGNIVVTVRVGDIIHLKSENEDIELRYLKHKSGVRLRVSAPKYVHVFLEKKKEKIENK